MTGQCWECETVGDVHHHHPVPKSRGGTKTIPLCQECHAKAHHRDKRMTTAELTREALAAKRRRGERISHDAPFGFAVSEDGKTLVKNAEEHRLALEILRLRQEGQTIRGIADRLNHSDVPCRGSRWHPTSVARLLKRLDAKTPTQPRPSEG